MNYMKISNFISNGRVDYKGVDIGLFIPSSQIYPEHMQYCVVATEQEDIPQHVDIKQLNFEEYELERQDYLSNLPQPFDHQKEVENLRFENTELKQAIAELTMMIAAAPQA